MARHLHLCFNSFLPSLPSAAAQRLRNQLRRLTRPHLEFISITQQSSWGWGFFFSPSPPFSCPLAPLAAALTGSLTDIGSGEMSRHATFGTRWGRVRRACESSAAETLSREAGIPCDGSDSVRKLGTPAEKSQRSFPPLLFRYCALAGIIFAPAVVIK